MPHYGVMQTYKCLIYFLILGTRTWKSKLIKKNATMFKQIQGSYTFLVKLHIIFRNYLSSLNGIKVQQD